MNTCKMHMNTQTCKMYEDTKPRDMPKHRCKSIKTSKLQDEASKWMKKFC
jgi:hypothetical protein